MDIERVILLQVGLQRFPIRMRLELMNQLLDCFFANVILLLDCSAVQSLNPEAYFTATSFQEFCTGRLVGGCSRVHACGILASIMQVLFLVQIFAVKWEIATFHCTLLLQTS